MKNNSNFGSIFNPSLYKKQVLEFYRECFERHGEKIISSGFDQYRENQWTLPHPIDGFLQTRGKMIVIELRASKRLEDEEIKKIIDDRFRPLGRRRKIIGIIESYKGFHEVPLKTLSFEDYPVVLTKSNTIIACNNQARWDKMVRRCFSSFFTPNHGNNNNNKDSKRGNRRNDKNYKMLAFILSGSVRMKIFAFLLKGSSYTSEIARAEELNFSSVTRSLRELEEKSVVKCTTPLCTRRKFYELTPKALKLKDDVLKRL